MLNNSYYIVDGGANKVYIVIDNWSFISSKTFYMPYCIITVANCLLMCGESNLWKLDDKLDTLIEYKATGSDPQYRGLFFNATNMLLYVASYALEFIHIFNINLTFIRNISTSPYSPWSVSGFNNQLHIGTDKGTVLVVLNDVIVEQFSGCGGSIVILT